MGAPKRLKRRRAPADEEIGPRADPVSRKAAKIPGHEEITARQYPDPVGNTPHSFQPRSAFDDCLMRKEAAGDVTRIGCCNTSKSVVSMKLARKMKGMEPAVNGDPDLHARGWRFMVNHKTKKATVKAAETAMPSVTTPEVAAGKTANPANAVYWAMRAIRTYRSRRTTKA